jgi:thiamine-monophosphate kinase
LTLKNMNFPDLGEFRFVGKILDGVYPLKKESPSHRGWLSAGDDCAIFDGWLATKDLSVENTHFRLDWSSPEQAVEKHIVSNVSDVSSMGGRPKIALFGLCVNKNWSEETRNRIAKAVSQGFERRGITLIGGDTVSGDVGMFSTTLLGTTDGEATLLRSAAKPGERVFVAGTLGKSDAGLWILMNHPEEAKRFPRLVEYHLAPKICEDAGAQLVKQGVRGACMDISDGLSSETNHLALSSNVSIEIDEGKLPIDPDVLEMSAYFGLSPLQFALNGGEEYELLFTSNLTKSIYLQGAPQNAEIHEIGFVDSGSGVFLKRQSGGRIILNAQAWSHL